MSHAQSVLDNIRTLMFVRRVTQAEVAERLGISQPAVSNRLRGRVPLAVDELLTLAELLEVEPSHLLEQAAWADECGYTWRSGDGGASATPHPTGAPPPPQIQETPR